MNADHFLDDVRRAVDVGAPGRHGHGPVVGDVEAERGEDALLLAIGNVDAAEVASESRIVSDGLARQRRLACTDHFAGLAATDVEDQLGQQVEPGIEERRIDATFDPPARVGGEQEGLPGAGDGSGIVPSSFRIARQLVSRLEDEKTGRILPEGLWVPIPEARIEQARAVVDAVGDEVFTKFPLVEGMTPVSDDPVELLLNKTWRPQLSVTGQEGMPALKDAGNVLRPFTTLKLSLRIPPTLSPTKARDVLRDVLTGDPPYGARIRCEFDEPAPGWNAPALAAWLETALDEASKTFFGNKAMHMGEGGSIPFMGMLGEKFPEAQFVITGVLGPGSNAHGPNEFLDIEYAKKLTAAVADILAAQAGARMG